jgi:CHAT domain-containing protein
MRIQYPALQIAPAGTTTSDLSFLHSQDCLVEYWEGESVIDIFTANYKMLSDWVTIPKDSQVIHFQRFFSDPDAMLNQPKAYLEQAAALYEKLIPAEARKARSILLIPDGSLLNLPFEALVEGNTGHSNLRTAPYLIRSHTIRYAWSASSLTMQYQYARHRNTGFLGIAPGFAQRERQLAPLSVQSEWAAMSGGTLTELIGPEATLARVKAMANQFSVLHFHTHADAAATPRIELIDDAMLLPDIYALRLNADLVALSACQTGIGVFQKGEGVMSLSRAFAQAGAANVMSSMWAVNDAATNRILNRFYECWNDKTAVSEALRTAKLDYISDKEIPAAQQSPYFWAAMIPVGADKKLPPASWGTLHWYGLFGGVLIVFFWWRWRTKRSEQ